MDDQAFESCRWRRVEAVLIGLLMLAPLLCDPWSGSNMASSFRTTYISLMALLLAAAFFLRPLFGSGFRFSPSLADVPVLLFLLLAALSFFWSVNHSVHLQRFTLLLSVCLAFYLIRIRIAEGDRIIHFIMLLLVVGLLVALVDSVWLFYHRMWDLAAAPTPGEEPLFKSGSILFSHDNVASIYIVVLMPIAFTALFFTEALWMRCVCGVALPVYLVYLFLLKSRAALIEAALAILVISVCLLLRKSRVSFCRRIAVFFQKRTVLILLAVLLVALFLLPLSKDFSSMAKGTFNQLVDFFGLKYERMYFRIDIWKKTMAMVSDHILLGVGLGNFPVIFPAYHKLELPKAHAHSEYYNTLAELGVVGLVFHLLLFVFLVKAVFNVSSKGSGREAVIALGLGCALLVTAIHGFVEPPLIFEASSLTIYACFALLLGLEGRVAGAKVVIFGPGGPIRRFLLPVIAVTGLGLVLPRLIPCFTQNSLLLKAEAAARDARLQEAEALYRKVSEVSYDSYFTHDRIGKICFRQAKFEEAYEEFLKAEALFPYFFKVHFDQGVALLKLKRPGEANEALLRCLDLNPRFKPAKLRHIEALVGMKDFDIAFRKLAAYLRSKNPVPADLKLAGELYYRGYQCNTRDPESRLHDLKNAIRCFEKCLKMGGGRIYDDLEGWKRFMRHRLNEHQNGKRL